MSEPTEGLTLVVEGGDFWRRPQNATQATQMASYVQRIGNVPGRCVDCAFLAGSDANRSEMVLHLVDNCLVKDGTFCCHHGAADRPCVGFVALRDSFAALTSDRAEPRRTNE